MPASKFHQRYELIADGKTKIVEIWREKHLVTTRTSGTGTRAKTKATPCKNQPLAVAEVEKAAAALEAAIAASPNDLTAFQVYADWLLEQNDPFGEFMSVQMARSEKPNDRALKAREKSIVKEHGREILGQIWGAHEPLSKHTGPPVEIEWQWGFMRAVAIRTDVVRFYKHLRALRSARLISKLRLQYHRLFGLDYPTVEKAFVEHGLPSLLSALTLVGERTTARGSLDLTPIAPLLDRLEHLEVAGHTIEFEPLKLPALKSLALRSTMLDRAQLQRLAKSSLPHLDSLELDFGHGEGTAPDFTISDLKTALKPFANVKTLKLEGPGSWASELQALQRIAAD